MTDDLDSQQAGDAIPAFLRLTAEERRAAWERNPPKPMPAEERSRELDELRAAARKQAAYERIEAMKLKQAAKKAKPVAVKIDHKRMRWDARRNRFVEDPVRCGPETTVRKRVRRGPSHHVD